MTGVQTCALPICFPVTIDVVLEQRTNPNLTIEKLNQIIVEPKIDINLTKEALACEDLWYQFKSSLIKRYELGDEDNQLSFYHT